MSYNVKPTQHFKAQAKKLSKHYSSFKDNLKTLTESLKENPLIGDDLGGGLRKIRLQVDSKGKGKRGGIRIIEFIAFCDKEVILMAAYDKSKLETISTKELKKMVKQL